MFYTIDDERFETASKAAYFITENLDDEPFDDMLDECYEEVEICGLSYAPSIAFYRTDEIAYSCARNDYYDSLAGDIEYELERMDDGDELDFYGFTVEAHEEADEDEEE